MKPLLLALLILPSVASADCTLWRGTVTQYADDGTYTTLDHAALFNKKTDFDVKVFTFGPYYGFYDYPIQTINVTMPDNGWNWFSISGTGPSDCQFTLGYQMSLVQP